MLAYVVLLDSKSASPCQWPSVVYIAVVFDFDHRESCVRVIVCVSVLLRTPLFCSEVGCLHLKFELNLSPAATVNEFLVSG